MAPKILRPILRHRFGFFLFLQGGLLLAAAFAQNSLFEEEIYLMALLGVLLGGGFSILRGTRHLAAFLAVATLTVAANVLAYFTSIERLDVLASVANLVFMAWVLFALVRRVFLRREVDDNIILGAACIYIHIGMMFSFVYLLIDYCIPHSFSQIAATGTGAEIGRLLEHFLYYSYVTLGTVGYGDIAPLSAPARYFSVFEAVLGQLYLAIVVARLVGAAQLSGGTDRR